MKRITKRLTKIMRGIENSIINGHTIGMKTTERTKEIIEAVKRT
jgi:hypothetical protein